MLRREEEGGSREAESSSARERRVGQVKEASPLLLGAGAAGLHGWDVTSSAATPLRTRSRVLPMSSATSWSTLQGFTRRVEEESALQAG